MSSGDVLPFGDAGLRMTRERVTRPATAGRPDVGDDRALIERAIAGDKLALSELVDRLAPVIHLRVAHVLRLRVRHRRSSRQEVEDFVQEVFTWILSHDRRALRSWDPDRLASLETFVGLLAQHRVLSILRSRRRSPWTEHAVAEASLGRPREGKQDPEGWLAERELLDRVLDQLAIELGAEGMLLLRSLIIAERPPEEVAALTGMSKGALYTWKSRTAKRAREIARTLLAEG